MCRREIDVEMVPIASGIPRGVDACIAPLIRALNEAGIETIASCCGHGRRPGNICLRDGRELVILPDWETGRRVDRILNEHMGARRISDPMPEVAGA